MMYRTLEEEELRKKIIFVATCAIETQLSTRKLASFISENYFSISNATVHSYLQVRLPKIDPILYLEVKKIIDSNTEKTIDDPLVLKRIKKSVTLLLEGYTIPEIVKELNDDSENQFGQVTIYTIYNDLDIRLKKIVDDNNFLNQIKKILKNHSIMNLNNQVKQTVLNEQLSYNYQFDKIIKK